jgi:hypothetical protein
MANINSYLKNRWEKLRIQRVVNFCNRKYKTHLKIKGRAEDIYPDLKGQINWDWICYDVQTKDEIAVEAKRITDPKIEELYNSLWQLFTEVQDNLNKSNLLPGIFHISFIVSPSLDTPFSRNNREELKLVLYNIVSEEAQRLKVGEDTPLTTQIKKLLSFELQALTSSNLRKLDSKGSHISKGSGIIKWGNILFSEKELGEFSQLVTHANEQLGKSKPRKTFLVTIEEGFRHKDPAAITDAFSRMKPDCYSNIDHIYFVQGKKVAEIRPPNFRINPSAS